MNAVSNTYDDILSVIRYHIMKNYADVLEVCLFIFNLFLNGLVRISSY